MKLIQTDIPDVVIIEPQVFSDDRGWFMESFNQERFQSGLKNLGLDIPGSFVQDSHSCSQKNVLRGLHYQLDPKAQGKLVRVTKGATYDVAVDLRNSSPTFGKWVGVELNERNQKKLWIPKGFAHGFISLEDNTHFLYKATDFYCNTSERSIRWDDPDIGINWPDVGEFLVSDKDRESSKFCDATVYNGTRDELEPKTLDLNVRGDNRGRLISIEQSIDIPFEIKRTYYIYDTKAEVARGFHAHRQLLQFAVCVSGKCRMILDDGHQRKSVWLSSPDKGLLIGNMVWREMHDFSDDCVLLVLASEYYNEADYIRNYDQFKMEVKHGKN